jgi:hypothetical protein
MLQRAVALALIPTMAFVLSSTGSARAQSTQAGVPWQSLDSQHFEIQYQPALAPRLDLIVRRAERAYDRITRQLNFVLPPPKVPLVIFAPSASMTPEAVRASAGAAFRASNEVAPQRPHRSRILLSLPEGDAQLDALIVHELTHILVSGLVRHDRIGDGGVPHWIKEGVAEYMVGVWRDEDVRQMRDLVASRDVPALSQLSGNGGFTNTGVNNAIGHAAFDYIVSRWGPSGVRLFLDALIMPRVSKTYDAVFELTPEQFDVAFRDYAVRRFERGAR